MTAEWKFINTIKACWFAVLWIVFAILAILVEREITCAGMINTTPCDQRIVMRVCLIALGAFFIISAGVFKDAELRHTRSASEAVL